MSMRISMLAIFLGLSTIACGLNDAEDSVEEAASVGSFAMSSTDTTNASMTWSTTNTRTSDITGVQSLIAEGPGDTSVYINLQGVTADGEYNVTDSNAVYPGILVVFWLDEARGWTSVSAKSAKVTLQPLTVNLERVVMEPEFSGGEPFTFNGAWIEK